MKKEIIPCTVCPKECTLNIYLNTNTIEKVEGNGCNRGLAHAEKELSHPERTLTTTMLVDSSSVCLIPVRSSKALPRDLLLKAMEVINKHFITPPISMGDVIIENILDTGVDIIASKSISL